MKLGGKQYRKLMAALDSVGITTTIHRAGKGCYQVIVNYEVVKQSRVRSSCNKYLTKLYRQHFPKERLMCRPVKTFIIKKYKTRRQW